MDSFEVTVVDATPAPIQLISTLAGATTANPNPSEARFATCWNNHHDSVLEHAKVSFLIEGLSRACTHQLVRHRFFSFVHESQRCKKMKFPVTSSWAVKPPMYYDEDNVEDRLIFDKALEATENAYKSLIALGWKPEDARYVLPQACKSMISCTVNLRELLYFFDCRLDKAAQWEIRDLAQAMLNECKEISVEWAQIMEMYEERRLVNG